MNQQREPTPRHFYLKPLTANDVERIAIWYEDIKDLAQIESRLSVPLNTKSLEKLWQNDMANTEPGTDYLYSIYDEAGEPIGHTGLQEISYAHGNGVVFIYVKKDMRRHGIGLRATALLLDLAYFQLRLHRITTYFHADNAASASLVKRLGFSDEGRMREAYFYDGEFGDVEIVGLLASEWAAIRGPLSQTLDEGVNIAFGRDRENRWIWPLRHG